MLVTYKNNRLMPALIITACIITVFYLVDPSVENYGFVATGGTKHESPKEAWIRPDEILDDNTADTIIRASNSETKSETVLTDTHQVSHLETLEDDDILLILKTGGTTMWKRLLVHLPTTFSPSRINHSNIAIYSDLPSTIGTFNVIDILSNMTDKAKASPDFDVYRQQPEYNAYNNYVEAAGVAGDEWGPTGGWTVDKYKFLPLIDHAGREWPNAKWYIYMEDDAYLFLPEIRRFLQAFDHREKHYLGSYAAKSNFIFAHGGAGFALSRGAWEASFGENKDLVDEYFDYTANHCCGDQVLGKALAEHGVKFGENGGDGKFTWGFNPVVHWTFAFSRHNWCKPLLSWHKVHNRDVAEYYDFEKSWDFSKPLRHKDFFTNIILPRIQTSTEWWDNMASQYEISSGNQAWAAAPEDTGTYDKDLWKNAWESVEACESACKAWQECMMWTYVEDLCKLDDKMIMGQGYAPGMSQRKTSLVHTSGWMTKRLEQWKCS